jgi:hypothetical protein
VGVGFFFCVHVRVGEFEDASNNYVCVHVGVGFFCVCMFAWGSLKMPQITTCVCMWVLVFFVCACSRGGV